MSTSYSFLQNTTLGVIGRTVRTCNAKTGRMRLLCRYGISLARSEEEIGL